LVWNDGQLERRLGELLENSKLREEMGRRGYEISRAWDWATVAPQWEQRLLETIENL